MPIDLEDFLEQMVNGDSTPAPKKKEPIAVKEIKEKVVKSVEVIKPKVIHEKKLKSSLKMPEWCFRLDSIDDFLDIKEFEHTYRFTRVEKTNKYTVNYKGSETDNWKLLPGHLSNKYIATKMSEYVDKLKATSPFEQEYTIAAPFKIAWFGILPNTINAFETNEAQQLINFAYNGANVKNTISKSSVLCVNHYNGSAKFKVDSIINNIIQTDMDDFTFNNLFTFHDSEGRIAAMRGCNINYEFVKSIASNFISRVSEKKVLAHWNDLDDKYKNLYYLTNLSSIVLKNWHFGNHNCLRALFSSKIVEII